MDKLVIIGKGGLAKIVIDIINQNNDYAIEGIVDRQHDKKSLCGIKVIGTDNDLADIHKSGIKKAVLAIGCVCAETTKIREAKFSALKNIGFEMANIIQNSTYISKTATIKEGNIIIGNCYIGPDVVIGSAAVIHPFTSIEHDSVIGDYVQLSQGVKVAGSVYIGKNSFVGMGACLVQGGKIADYSFIKSNVVYYTKK